MFEVIKLVFGSWLENSSLLILLGCKNTVQGLTKKEKLSRHQVNKGNELVYASLHLEDSE
jgi:hypothetical protein